MICRIIQEQLSKVDKEILNFDGKSRISNDITILLSYIRSLRGLTNRGQSLDVFVRENFGI